MRSCILVLAVMAACAAPATSPPVPSLHGVVVISASDHATPAVIDRIAEWVPARADCVANAYGGIELSADVATAPGTETILASFSQGVIVLAADGHRIATAPGFDCMGSQDDLVAVEVVRTTLDRPLIAVVATQGGRRENATWLELFAVGASDRLDRLFVGELGDVTLMPGGLVYRHPTEGVSMWRYDARLGYVRWRTLKPTLD
jgi:hypothetical protein